MTLIEGIGDEVVQFFVGLLFILIVALAWCTTNTSNDGTYRTVFLLDRRRLRAVRRLITHTESSTIVEGTTAENSETNQTNPTMEEDKPSSTSTDTRRNEAIQSTEEETRIVEAMDAPNNMRIFRSRLCLNPNTDASNNPSSSECDISTLETSQSDCTNDVIADCIEPDIKPSSSKTGEENQENDKICVKLKFVTDELRQVDGSLKENIGDFKRRHFEVELAANKVVKLIFNGQILQREGDTLQSYGFFDNCVVHCVFLPATNTFSQGTTSGSRDSSSAPFGADSRSNNNNQQSEWHLENYLLAILCCFLGAAWYLRYVYSHLYTVTATIGLILMTGIFSIIMFGVHFPDNLDLNRERVVNVHTHQ